MTNMLKCPRCRGYLHANRDQYGAYRECLQCGYMVDVQKREERKVTSASKAKMVA